MWAGNTFVFAALMVVDLLLNFRKMLDPLRVGILE